MVLLPHFRESISTSVCMSSVVFHSLASSWLIIFTLCAKPVLLPSLWVLSTLPRTIQGEKDEKKGLFYPTVYQVPLSSPEFLFMHLYTLKSSPSFLL